VHERLNRRVVVDPLVDCESVGGKTEMLEASTLTPIDEPGELFEVDTAEVRLSNQSELVVECRLPLAFMPVLLVLPPAGILNAAVFVEGGASSEVAT